MFAYWQCCAPVTVLTCTLALLQRLILHNANATHLPFSPRSLSLIRRGMHIITLMYTNPHPYSLHCAQFALCTYYFTGKLGRRKTNEGYICADN